MGKRYIAQNVKCPFYHSEDAQKIYCEGIQKGSSLHLAFGSKTDKKLYKAKFCIECHNECALARMLYEKNGEGGA